MSTSQNKAKLNRLIKKHGPGSGVYLNTIIGGLDRPGSLHYRAHKTGKPQEQVLGPENGEIHFIRVYPNGSHKYLKIKND